MAEQYDNNWDWVYEYFTESDIAELTDATDDIIYDDEHGMSMYLEFSDDQCKEIVYHYYNARSMGRNHVPSAMFVSGFLSSIIQLIHDYLNEPKFREDD
jgi:hypothetical protein